MADTLGTKGAELNLLVRQGATQGPYRMTINKADGSPLDITGGLFRAQIRRTANSAPIPGCTFTFTIITPLSGIVEWSIDADSTGVLQASETSETDPLSTYVWDMELELASGRIIPLTYGAVNVFREVTKDE